MAGGTFSSINKVRPGAYINFETDVNAGIPLGERGIAAFTMPLHWGAEASLIEVSGYDLVNNDVLAKIGLSSSDADILPVKLALANCEKVKIYKSNQGGTKATVTLDGGLVITAKYNGTFGNKIAISIKATGSQFIVETYADGYFVDSQKVTGITDLVANDYVEFSGTGTLAALQSTLLEDGTDGATPSTATTPYTAMFELLRTSKWNTLAVPSNESTVKEAVVTFINQMRTEEGKYVQAVLANYASADYEGIINSINGVVLEDDTIVSAENFTAWVAGATAGAAITESLTGKLVQNAVSITGMLTNAQIIDALNAGKFVLSLNQDGSVKVEKDINSLHSFTPQKPYIYSKNRIIRELDEIGSNIENIWEKTYLGKVTNDENGRALFRASIVNYLTELQNRGAITEFNSDLVQVQGGGADIVLASIAVKPLDSMEFLYMVVNVEQ